MIRKIFAIISGVLAGGLLSSAISAGVKFRFPEEFESLDWGVLIWGEHWFLRALVSLICTAWAGFVAGVIGREKGKILAIIAVLPGWILWACTEYIALTGHFPLFSVGDVYVSIGNKLSMGFIIIAMFPVAWIAGSEGEIIGQEFSTHFDSRKYTLLGIKWYHYFWIPIVLQLILVEGSYAGLYFLTWLKALWKAGFSIFNWIIPGIFTLALWGTLYLMGIGMMKAYLILAGFEEIPSKGKAFIKVVKYAIGFQVIAAALQSLIQYLHFLIGKWLS